jgi:two-component system phosphate regulon response regulator PhoB
VYKEDKVMGGYRTSDSQRKSSGEERNNENVITILLVESSDDLRNVLAASLQQQGWQVMQAESEKAARQILDNNNPDVLVLEFDPPRGIDGDLIEIFHEKHGSMKGGSVLLMAKQRPTQDWWQRYCPDTIIFKPFDVRFLCSRIRAMIQNEHGPEK